jgi:hypothetical protein
VGVVLIVCHDPSPAKNVVLLGVPVAESFATVTLALAILAVVTALSAMSAVSTAPAAIFAVVTDPSAKSAVVMTRPVIVPLPLIDTGMCAP